MKCRNFAAVALPIVAILACGQGGPSSASATNMSVPTAGDFPKRFAAAACENVASCCAAGGVPFNDTGCRFTAEGTLTGIIAARTGSGRIILDPVAGEACLKAYSAALAGCTNEAAADLVEPACNKLFKGTVALGGQCSESAECAQTDTQVIQCDQGLCKVYTGPSFEEPPTAKFGEACSQSCVMITPHYRSCAQAGSVGGSPGTCWVEDGLTCSNGSCASVPKLGEACTFFCATGAYCDLGRCVPQRESGPCIQSDACAASAFCGITTNECTPKKQDRTACQEDFECLNGYCGPSGCQKWTAANSSSCSGLINIEFD
ncbi:MAG: hypothetical protein SFV15_05460 [Polyangiaceae bacterium]|nr:hypothetical protein [Polyangiaceae bacterium]